MVQRVMSRDLLNYAGPDIFAVDPGVNFGLTIVTAASMWVYHGSLLRAERSLEYAWYAYNFMRDVLEPSSQPIRVVIEGAAYHKTYGQVGLADVRTGFYLGARSMVSDEAISILAPMSARKLVFDNGKAEPWNIFPKLNHNGLDSLVLAAAEMGTSLRPDFESQEGDDPGV